MPAALCASLAPAGAAPKDPKESAPGQTVEVQLLAINDFHGNLESPRGPIAGIPAGGAEYLATDIRQLEATNRNTMVTPPATWPEPAPCSRPCSTTSPRSRPRT